MKIQAGVQRDWAATPVSSLQGKLGRLSEMQEMESLRLQAAMDRQAKLLSTLSNLLKKATARSSDRVQNLK